jgi:hypothetical protein
MRTDLLRSAYYRLPQALQRAILVKRRQRIWIDAGIVFVHIPKAAGTSVNEALYGRFMGHVHAWDIERWGSAKLKSLPSFSITRNPWDRLVSAYRFARRGRGIGGIEAGVWRPQQYQDTRFESFDRFVREWLAKRDPAKLDPIFQPQWTFVCRPDGQLLPDHVGRLENLEPTLDFIRVTTGAPIEVEQSNRSGESTDYRDFYTPDLAEMVGGIYRQDIEIFGYSF